MTMVPPHTQPNHLSNKLLYCGSLDAVSRFSGCDGDDVDVDVDMNGQVCEYSSITTTSNTLSKYSYLGGSDLFLLHHMAEEDESTTNSLHDESVSRRDEIEPWLQLSIGSNNHHHHQPDSPSRTSSRLVELDLLPGGRSRDTTRTRSSSTLADPIFHTPRIPILTDMGFCSQPRQQQATTSRLISTPSFFQHRPGSSNFLQQEINWAFRPILPQNVTGMAPVPSSSPSTSSSFLPMGGASSYYGRPLLQFQGSGGVVDVPGPSSEGVRIINPPRRPHSGIWFTLKALENQAKEPFLPQISKNYLKIKDGKMTIRLVIKYLVNKLNLDSESEIEIRCRGQHLLPFLTLQHVRDSIWNPSSSSSSSRDSLFNLLPDSSTTDHLMILHYGRINK